MDRSGETGIRLREIEYRPLESQQRFHDSGARFKGFSGPIGSGKSQALCQEAIKLSYFPTDGAGHSFSGMPFYDAWNQSQFEAEFGTAMTVFTTNTVNPASYPNEASYLPEVIGSFTNAITTFVRASLSDCRFEVLYPTDTNQTAFNQVFNFPVTAWTPSALTILKTENFGFTFERNLDAAEATMEFGESLGFQAMQRSQLVGVSDSTTAWIKEVETAAGKGFESVVIFALDQYCLIGYATPLPGGLRRSLRMG